MNTSVPPGHKPGLDVSHVEDLKLAASKRLGSQRRSFQAAMAVKYCQGNPRQAEEVLGWSRHTVALGLHERRTGIICLGAQEAYCGNKRGEERHPEAAAALRALAETPSPPDPSFRTPLYYTRLTAAEAIQQWRAWGFAEAVVPSPSPLAQGLNRNDYRRRPVLKAKPQVPETAALLAHLRAQDALAQAGGSTQRLSLDGKATVNLGEYSRGGETRGDDQAGDHDRGCKEKHTPFAMGDEDTGQLPLIFGRSAKTRDFIVDGWYHGWEQWPQTEREAMSRLQIKADNGPQSHGRGTPCLKRRVEFADHIGTPVHWLYSPPYPSNYTPGERGWGILEKHWNGTKRVDVDPLLGWARSMTWKGLPAVVELSRKVYPKGISLSKKIMQEVEARLERHPLLPKWDILIRPV